MTAAEFIQYCQAAGGLLVPPLAILYYMERDERKEAQAELRLVTREAITAMVEMRSTVNQFIAIFKPNNGGQ